MNLDDPLDMDLDLDAGEASDQEPSGAPTLALWLLVMSAAILAAPMLLISGRLDAENQRLSADVLQMQTAAAQYGLPNAESGDLQSTLTHVQALSAEVEAVSASLSSSYIDWPNVLNVIMAYDINLLGIDGLVQTENRLVISGRAETEAAVMAYADHLDQSELFSRVVVQAITLTVTPTPGSAVQPRPLPGSSPVRADAPIEFNILVEIKAVAP